MSDKMRYVLGSAIYAIGGVLYGLFVVTTDNKALAAIILGIVFTGFGLGSALFVRRIRKKGGPYSKQKEHLLETFITAITMALLHYAFSPDYNHRVWFSVMFGMFCAILYLIIVIPLSEKEREKREKKIGDE